MSTPPASPTPLVPVRSPSGVVLSRLKADVLIWWPPFHTIACFESRVVGPVTSDTLLCWLNMLADVSQHGTLTVRRVWVRQRAPFRFSAKPLEAIAPADVLDRGDYGLFYVEADNDPDFTTPILPFDGLNRRPSLEAMKRLFDNWVTPAAIARVQSYNISEELIEAASRRDGGKCLLTGCTSSQDSPVDVYWIFPPGMVDRITTLQGKRAGHLPPLTEFFIETDNLITVRSDIYELWHKNAFSVDVDDGCRIRILAEEAMKVGLPDRLAPVPNSSALDYFREHFRHTLCVKFLGGCITVDATTINEFLVEIGLDEEGTIDDSSDKLFQMLIEKGYFEKVMRERLGR
ncbi:uncharacterized protein C8Q71DRAFT_769917 [Rhodofomes roseus]|uniref:Uncharacterized protein n=1 Tax=Rhodofomes roseus TaxID=34475 RepID=A0ABQ8KCA4_9APHY|nr:uncharacterized protein C8Q71DRAFT_769917 [Rhodofomes roseus]KAH9834611.1 hypothetical protein C8Q71DRAFT_769917 [Rhodofomes roseus]